MKNLLAKIIVTVLAVSAAAPAGELAAPDSADKPAGVTRPGPSADGFPLSFE